MKMPPVDAQARLALVIRQCLTTHKSHTKAREYIMLMLDSGKNRDELKACVVAMLPSNRKGQFQVPTGEWLFPDQIQQAHLLPKSEAGPGDVLHLGGTSQEHNLAMGNHTQFVAAGEAILKARNAGEILEPPKKPPIRRAGETDEEVSDRVKKYREAKENGKCQDCGEERDDPNLLSRCRKCNAELKNKPWYKKKND